MNKDDNAPSYITLTKHSLMMTVKQAAERLNVSEKTVRNMVKCGKLPHHRIGAGRGVIRISEHALEQHLAESEVRESLANSQTRTQDRRRLRHIKI